MPKVIVYLLINIFLINSPFVVPAAENLARIEKISVEKKTETDLVQLIFKSPYKESISYHYDPGMVRLTLPHSEFDDSLKEIVRINDRFIDDIRLDKEGLNTSLVIKFVDRDFQATSRIKIKTVENQLSIVINKLTDLDNDEMEPRVDIQGLKGKESPSALSFSDDLLTSSDVTVSIVKMLVALSGILLFFYSLLWAYNRFFVRKFSFKKGDHSIKMVSSYHVSPKQKIIVLNVDEKTFACGVTSNNINLISEIRDDSFDRFVTGLNYEENSVVDFSKLRTQYLESKIAKDNTISAKSTSSFATELMNKVKKLKPID
jgi:flagellar biogenesis protein FliO